MTRDRIKPLMRTGWVIVNPYGSVWHDTLFKTEDDACQFLKIFWGDMGDHIKDFTVIPGRAMLEPLYEQCECCGAMSKEPAPTPQAKGE